MDHSKSQLAKPVSFFIATPGCGLFFARASIIHIDGMPLVYWARLLGYPVRKAHRVTYVDWVHPLMATAEAEGWRIFYLGGKPGVAARAARKLQERYPRLLIRTHHAISPRKKTKPCCRRLPNFGRTC